MIEDVNVFGLASGEQRFPVRAWLIGGPGTGKTGSLAGLLLEPEVKIRLISGDGNFQALVRAASGLEPDPKRLSERLLIKRIKQPIDPQGLPNKLAPTAWDTLHKVLGAPWIAGEPKPREWGPEHVLVIDNLSSVTGWASDRVRISCSKLTGALEYKEWQLIHDNVWRFYEGLASHYECSVLCLTHADYMKEDETPGSPVKGFPSTLGEKLGKKIAGTFETLIQYQIRSKVRKISVRPSSTMDVKIPLPPELLKEEELPADTGLGKVFGLLYRGGIVPKTVQRPTPKGPRAA